MYGYTKFIHKEEVYRTIWILKRRQLFVMKSSSFFDQESPSAPSSSGIECSCFLCIFTIISFALSFYPHFFVVRPFFLFHFYFVGNGRDTCFYLPLAFSLQWRGDAPTFMHKSKIDVTLLLRKIRNLEKNSNTYLVDY